MLNEHRMEELKANLAPGLLARLAAQCLDDLALRLPALQAALTTGENAKISVEAHAMAGMAASYGMSAMEARLQYLMSASLAGDMLTANRAGADLVEDLDRTDAALRSMFLVPSV